MKERSHTSIEGREFLAGETVRTGHRAATGLPYWRGFTEPRVAKEETRLGELMGPDP